MVKHTIIAPVGAHDTMPDVQSQWMTFMEWREWSTEHGNGNDEFIEFTWSRRKRERYRGGHLEKLMMIGLTCV